MLLSLAAEHGVKYIASNDVHFIMAEDAPAHDRLICLNTGRDLDDPDRMRYTFQEYLKSEEEMAALFPDHPEALATTAEIAAKIEEYSLEHKPLMPNFPIPDDFPVPEECLRETFLKKMKEDELPDDIRRLVKNTCIISTPFDSLRAVRRIFQAIPVSRLAQKGEIRSFYQK